MVAGEDVVVLVVDGGVVVVVVDGGIVVVVVDGGIVVVVVVGAVEGGVVDNVVVLEELVVGDVGFVVDVPAMMPAMAPMSRMPPPRASHRRRRGRR